MKDYKAIADSVLRRRDEYIAEKKRKRALFIKRSSIALSCCLVLLAGFGIWRMDLLEKIIPSQNGNDYNVTEYTGEITGEPGGEPSPSDPDTTASYTDGTAAATAPEVTGSSTATTSRGTQSTSSTAAVKTTSSAADHVRVTTTMKKTGDNVPEIADGAVTTTHTARTTTPRPIHTTTTSRTTTTSHAPTTATMTTTSYTTTRISTTTSGYFTSTATTNAAGGAVNPTTTTTTLRTSSITTMQTTTTSLPWLPTTTTTLRWTSTTTTAWTTITTAWTTTTTAWTTTTTAWTTTTTSSVAIDSSTTTNPDQGFWHEGFYGDNGAIYFELTGTEADPSLIGELIEQGVTDPGTAGAAEYDLYRFGNNDDKFLRAVKYGGRNDYFLCINTEWIPDDLYHLVSGMDVGTYMEFESVLNCENGLHTWYPDRAAILSFLADNGSKATVIGVSDNFLLNEYREGRLSAPPEDDTDQLLMRIEITLPQLIPDDKYYSRGYMKITRDGRLIFDMMELKYTYNIGTEAAEGFTALLSQ